jgi:hypothetical protein
MMDSKDDNKRKCANGVEKEVEEAPPKKQKTIGDDNVDDYSLEPKEEVSLEEEEMNLPTGSEEELLIR